MKLRWVLIVLASLFALSTPIAASETTAPAGATSRDDSAERAAIELRIARIAHALQTANATICRDLYPQTGVVVRIQPVESPGAGTRPLPIATMIVPGSAADRAGLRTGDEIITVGGIEADDVLNPGSSFRRAWLDAERSGMLELSVKTPGESARAATVAGSAGCNALFEFVASDTPNAITYGNRIIVYRGLTKLTRSDDELAFVMAHELAHALLHHSDEGNDAAVRRKATRFAMEQDADRLGLLLMINAGFDARVAGPWNGYFAERSHGRLQKLVGAYGPYMPTRERVRYLQEHSEQLLALPRPLQPGAVGLELR